MDNQRPKRSLKDEIQKRKTQQIEREIEARRISQATGSTQSPQQAGQPQTRPPARQTTGHASGQPTRLSSSRTNQPISRLNQRVLMLAGGVAVAVVLLLGVLLISGGPAPSVANTSAPLPVVSAQDVVNYFKMAGVPISGLRSLSVPNDTWRAKQEFQFDVQKADQKGTFLVLSYDSPTLTGADAFRAANSERFKTWKQVVVSNVIMLAAPSSAQPLNDELASHLTQYLVAPYRTYLKTSTGQPAAALATGAAATSTAMNAAISVTVTYVTLPPRTLEPTTPPTATATRSTSTPLPTRTSTPTPPPIQTIPFSVTLPPSEPSAAALPTGTPLTVVERATPAEPTSPPTITPSGPTIAPQITNARAFNEKAPEAVGPFTLIKGASTTDDYGSTISYVTSDGQLYRVVLWLTNSAQDALERYQIEASTVNGSQPVTIGDEAILTSPGNSVLAVLRSRNVVVVVYRPDDPAASTAITDEDIIALLQGLYDALPA